MLKKFLLFSIILLFSCIIF
jgi:micrococcal nuclease